MHHEHPELIRDQYWDEVFPTELPYTVASEQYREKHPEPSTANIAVTEAEAEYTAPSSLKIDGDLTGMVSGRRQSLVGLYRQTRED